MDGKFEKVLRREKRASFMGVKSCRDRLASQIKFGHRKALPRGHSSLGKLMSDYWKERCLAAERWIEVQRNPPDRRNCDPSVELGSCANCREWVAARSAWETLVKNTKRRDRTSKSSEAA